MVDYLVMLMDGFEDRNKLGVVVESMDGLMDGSTDGLLLGFEVGTSLGIFDGSADGNIDGIAVYNAIFLFVIQSTIMDQKLLMEEIASISMSKLLQKGHLSDRLLRFRWTHNISTIRL